MRKGFIVRDRSLSHLPSKELSADELRSQNSLGMKAYKIKMVNQSKTYRQKEEEEVLKLKAHLDYALQMAVNEALQRSKAKEQSMRSIKNKMFTQRKLLSITQQLNGQKVERMKVQGQLAGLQHQFNKEQSEKKKLKEKQIQTMQQFDKVKRELLKIAELQQKLSEISPLKSRIKILQFNIREQKLKSSQIFQGNKQLLKQREQLKQKIKQSKAQSQSHLQQIGLLERVNFDLQKKINNFCFVQKEYNKKIGNLENQLNKMTTNYVQQQSMNLKSNSILQEKIMYISQLEAQRKSNLQQNKSIGLKLQKKIQQNVLNEQKLAQSIESQKQVKQQNEDLKKKNQVLQHNQLQMRKIIGSYLKISEQTNLYIIERNNQIKKLQSQKHLLTDNLEELEQKFNHDQIGFREIENQIKQSYFEMLKQRNKHVFQMKQYKQEMTIKIIEYGEQRDSLQRKINEYSLPLPSDETLYEAIIADKKQQLLILQSSNDQLLKIKKEMVDRVRELQKSNEQLKKEILILKLQNVKLFNTRKDLQAANQRGNRYQQMIQAQKTYTEELNRQLDEMRVCNKEKTEKICMLGIDLKNLNFKIEEYETLMKQLDLQYLNSKKLQNERNFHLIFDTVEKIKSGIYSLSYYFSCCFCNELVTNFITIFPCGHSYCRKIKCKNANKQYCYQCDSGQSIQRCFQNKYLKQAAEKYKFLTIIIKQAESNIDNVIPKQSV